MTLSLTPIGVDSAPVTINSFHWVAVNDEQIFIYDSNKLDTLSTLALSYQETADGDDRHSFLFDSLDTLTVETINYQVSVSSLETACVHGSKS